MICAYDYSLLKWIIGLFSDDVSYASPELLKFFPFLVWFASLGSFEYILIVHSLQWLWSGLFVFSASDLAFGMVSILWLHFIPSIYIELDVMFLVDGFIRMVILFFRYDSIADWFDLA